MKHIFIIGSKGIPAKYGGFETFVEKLVENYYSKNLKFHISCMADDKGDFLYKNARCFNINTPDIGSAKAVLYDLMSLNECIRYIEKNNLFNSVIYILACRIGPFLPYFKLKLKKLGIQFYVNPDGHEWKRSKWNNVIKKYWKISEKYMIKHADLVICDSKGIENYIRSDYRAYNPNTVFIPYGAELEQSKPTDDKAELIEWYEKNKLREQNYYLIVGRFVPENNYKLMIEEFMKSSSGKDLVIITNYAKNKFYNDLLQETNFIRDKRIKFVGTVYNQKLLTQIREGAFGYIHGHEVGGTNPSLLEAMATTKLNLLLDVVFNKEVGEDAAWYFSKRSSDLSNLINMAEKFSQEEIDKLGIRARQRIVNDYTWNKIVQSYKALFENV